MSALKMETLTFPKLRFKEFESKFIKKSLMEISNIKIGHGLSREAIVENGKNKCIFYSDLFTKYYSINPIIKTTTNEKGKTFSTENNLLFPSVYSGNNTFFKPISLNEKNILIGNFITLFEINENFNSDYISLYFWSFNNAKTVYKILEGTLAQQLHAKYLKNIEINISENLLEQNKIVDFFTLIIKQIELHKKVLENYKKVFNYFVFNPLKNFFIKSSKLVFMKDILKEVKIYNTYKKVTKILSLSRFFGFIDKEEFFRYRKDGMNNISKYKVIFKGHFAYNPMIGEKIHINRLNNFEEGLISPDYITFKVNNDSFLPEYINYFFKSKMFAFCLKKELRGGIRKRLLFNGLKNIKADLPSIEDQKHIANFLEKIEKILEKQVKIEEMLIKRKTFLLNSIFN